MNTIICDDSVNGLKKVSDNSVHLTFTSPPYNATVKYNSYSDDLSFDHYMSWLEDVFREVYRVTVSGGRCAINIDAIKKHTSNSSTEFRCCIYTHICNMMTKIGWLFRDEICWYKQNIGGKKASWGSWLSCSNPCTLRNHEYILIFCKDGWKLDGDKEQSDMTKEEFIVYTMSTWLVHTDNRHLANHPAIFPEELAKRIIKLYSYRDNVILDPFCGSGTVPYVAKLNGRRYIGVDIDKDYCEFASDRIDNANDIFEKNYIPRSQRISDSKLRKVDIDNEDMDLF